MIGGHGARNAAGPASKADVGGDTIEAEATTALERFRQRSRSYRGHRLRNEGWRAWRGSRNGNIRISVLLVIL